MNRAFQLDEVKHILKQGLQILNGKSEDYAGGEDAFSNFEFTGMCLQFAIEQGLAGAHLAFLALITTKLARLISLLGGNKLPNNETIQDTFVDLANYSALWGGWVASKAASKAPYEGQWGEVTPTVDEAEIALEPSRYLDARGRINPFVGKSEVAQDAVVFADKAFMPGFGPEPQNRPPKSFLSVVIPYEGQQDIRFFNPGGVQIWRASYYINHMSRLSWTNAQEKNEYPDEVFVITEGID